jgi:recombination protein RecT
MNNIMASNQTTTEKPTNLPAKTDPRVSQVRNLLIQAGPSISAVIPKHMTPERLIKIATTAVSKNPKLLECDQMSFLRAIMISAELGLEPDTPLQEAHLIPFKNNKRKNAQGFMGVMEVQFITGYRGLIDLIMRSGKVASIEARVVYENDKFEISLGLNPILVHVPELDKPRGKFRLVYGVARFKDATSLPYVDFMPKEDVDYIKAKSKAANDGPWVTDYDQMAKKTMIRRMSNYLPKSVELRRAIEVDTQADLGKTQTLMPELTDLLIGEGVIEAEQEGQQSTQTEKLAEKLEGKAGGQSTPEPEPEKTIDELREDCQVTLKSCVTSGAFDQPSADGWKDRIAAATDVAGLNEILSKLTDYYDAAKAEKSTAKKGKF